MSDQEIVARAITDGAQAWNDANRQAGHAVAPYGEYVAAVVLAELAENGRLVPEGGAGMSAEEAAIARWLATDGDAATLLTICRSAHEPILAHIDQDEQARRVYDALIRLGTALTQWEDGSRAYRLVPEGAVVLSAAEVASARDMASIAVDDLEKMLMFTEPTHPYRTSREVLLARYRALAAKLEPTP